jgi:hypothetical protein
MISMGLFLDAKRAQGHINCFLNEQIAFCVVIPGGLADG